VFGTNVFDRIEVIEIQSTEFENVWFFTVDLDASIINHKNPLLPFLNESANRFAELERPMEDCQDKSASQESATWEKREFSERFIPLLETACRSSADVGGSRSRAAMDPITLTAHTGFEPVYRP
jgi:hypothetical protein